MNKIVIVLLVAIVAAAGITVAFMPGDEESQEEPLPLKGDVIAKVYGNADGNLVIDETDRKIMEAIIAGDKMKDDFPLADMNLDDVVDQADLDMIQMYFDKVPMKLNVIEENGDPVTVQHPIDHLMFMSGSAMVNLINVFDITDRLSGIAVWHTDPIRDSKFLPLAESGKILKISPWGSAAENDLISKTNTQVLVTEASGMFDIDSDENMKLLKTWGIDTLRLECKDPHEHLKSVAIMGILFDQTDAAQKYYDFAQGVLDDIKKYEGKQYGTKTCMLKGAFGFAGKDNRYSKFLEAAGGNNLLAHEEGRGYHEGDQWIYEDKYKAEVYIVQGESSYGGTGFSDKTIAEYDTFNKTYTWKHGGVYMYDYTGHPLMKVAHIAEALYPDLFPEGWALNVHQQIVDMCFDPSQHYKVPEDRFFMKIN